MDNIEFSEEVLLDFEKSIQEYCSSITTETVTNSGKVIQLPLNLVNATQSQFHGLMQYIYNNNIKGKYILTVSKEDRTKPGTIYALKSSNAYNIDKLNTLLEWYINTCNRYDKAITEVGYTLLTGINYDSIREWRKNNNTDRVSYLRFCLAEKLHSMEEESLQSINITGKRNAVGIIEMLNYKHGHSARIAAAETAAKVNAMPASALPVLAIEPQQRITADTAEQQNSSGNS